MNRASKIFLLALSLIVLYACYLIIKPFWEPLFFAVLIAIVLYPVHNRVRKLIRSGGWAALVSTLFVLLMVMAPAIFLGVKASTEIASLSEWLGKWTAEEGGIAPYVLHLVDRAVQALGQYVDLSQFDVRGAIIAELKKASVAFPRLGASLAGNLLSFLASTVVTFVILFFLFREGASLLKRLEALLPLTTPQVERLYRGVSDAILANVYGGIAVGIAQGLLTGAACAVLGVGSPILLGVGTAIVSLVPVVGSAVVWVPVAIVLMVNGHWIKGLILLGWGAAVVSTIDNIIRPYFLSRGLKVNTLVLLLALLGGVQAFGFVGLFLGPVVVSVGAVLLELLQEESGQVKLAQQSGAES
jgi:predicted PurR-regulated permease PerM